MADQMGVSSWIDRWIDGKMGEWWRGRREGTMTGWLGEGRKGGRTREGRMEGWRKTEREGMEE